MYLCAQVHALMLTLRAVCARASSSSCPSCPGCCACAVRSGRTLLGGPCATGGRAGGGKGGGMWPCFGGCPWVAGPGWGVGEDREGLEGRMGVPGLLLGLGLNWEARGEGG